MGRRRTQTATQHLREPALLTPSQTYALRYLARWGTMFGKPKMMALLSERGLVEPCGDYHGLGRWRLTEAGRSLAGGR